MIPLFCKIGKAIKLPANEEKQERTDTWSNRDLIPLPPNLWGGYFYHHGMNWRCLPVWIAGWAPTVGGLSVTVQGTQRERKALYEMYYISFFLGYFISFILFYAVNKMLPPSNVGQIDDTDFFGTFTLDEAKILGVTPINCDVVQSTTVSDEKLGEVDVEAEEILAEVAKKDM
ncbi:hypothetical protein PQX77_017917 [Marasmius sp. AFHP31]|nr:hypothetical protein PQX77_017917 [Marasmius sp. AFHP31]